MSMCKCKECIYFKCKREIYFYTTSPSLTIGECLYDKRNFGNLTYCISEACEHFIHNEKVYNVGDVLRKGNEVLFVTGIFMDYYPRIYRITNNKQTTYSASAAELHEYELIARLEKENERYIYSAEEES